eukprot:CAMPEP_0182419530 /NCGR_PEP_ID=MMETSP1167-20130531/3965_1 /TAXON_ID=2988 /ORGANISM="Mallomonas Sp, Strain CCMP3275" /LENGTH=271 /DNA_ID=CAMNT_0024594499 /DNA_START=655 /DNA_END=1470 /DNA_ORIENTATION=-
MIPDFEVKIVFVYRELLNWFMSYYSQQVKMLHTEEAMDTYLFSHFDSLRRQLYTALDDYTHVFGRESLVVIDYYGALSAGRDTPTAVYCALVNTHCDLESDTERDSEKELQSTTMNKRTDITQSEITFAFKAYAQLHDCRFRTSYDDKHIFNLIPDCLNGSRHHTPGHWPAVPTTPMNIFSSLRPASQELDAFLRTQYRENMCYGDKTANQREMTKVLQKATAVDRMAMFLSKEWSNRMREVLTACYLSGVCIKEERERVRVKERRKRLRT